MQIEQQRFRRGFANAVDSNFFVYIHGIQAQKKPEGERARHLGLIND